MGTPSDSGIDYNILIISITSDGHVKTHTFGRRNLFLTRIHFLLWVLLHPTIETIICYNTIAVTFCIPFNQTCIQAPIPFVFYTSLKGK